MWYVVLINVIKIGGCVVLCLGIGVCMLMYVLVIPKHNTTHPPILITLISTTYHIKNYITFCISIFAGYHML